MYELMLILESETSEENRKKLFTKIEKAIEAPGKISEIKDLGKKTLAYPIKKKLDGHYWLLMMSMSGKEAASLTDKLKQEDSVLRMLLIKKDE